MNGVSDMTCGQWIDARVNERYGSEVQAIQRMGIDAYEDWLIELQKEFQANNN